MGQALAAAIVVVTLTSCDASSVADVEGVVTVGGKPVHVVDVQLVPTATLAYGGVDDSGHYKLGRAMGRKGCATGTYTVRLSERDPGSLPFRIPVEMSNASTMTVEVKRGPNTFDFDIPVLAKPGSRR